MENPERFDLGAVVKFREVGGIRAAGPPGEFKVIEFENLGSRDQAVYVIPVEWFGEGGWYMARDLVPVVDDEELLEAAEEAVAVFQEWEDREVLPAPVQDAAERLLAAARAARRKGG